MPDSFSDFMARKRQKVQSEYDKQAQDYADDPEYARIMGVEAPAPPPSGMPAQGKSFSQFLADKQGRGQPGAMGDMRTKLESPPAAISRPVTDPSQVENIPVYTPDGQFTGGLPLTPQAPPKRVGMGELRAVEAQPAKMPPITSMGSKQVDLTGAFGTPPSPTAPAASEAAQAKLAQRKAKVLATMKDNPDVLAAAIADLEVLPKDVESLPIESLPFLKLQQNPKFREAGLTGVTDPAKGREMLLNIMNEREQNPANQALRGVTHGTVDSLTFGLPTPIASSGSAVENTAEFVGNVAGQIPTTMGVAGIVGRVAANPLVRGALTGAAMGTGREVAGAVARPEEFNVADSLKNITSSAAEYAAYMGVYGKLEPVVEKLVSASPRLEQVLATLPGEVLKGGAVGAVAGASVGVGKATIDALASEGLDVKAMARKVLQESGQETKEELVEAIALGIAQKLIGGRAGGVPITHTQTETPSVVQPQAQAPATPTYGPETFADVLIGAAKGDVDQALELARSNPMFAETVPVLEQRKADAATAFATLAKAPHSESAPVPAPVQQAPAAAEQPTTALPALDRAELLRTLNPGMDEKAVRDLVHTTANLSDADFQAQAPNWGKPPAEGDAGQPAPLQPQPKGPETGARAKRLADQIRDGATTVDVAGVPIKVIHHETRESMSEAAGARERNVKVEGHVPGAFFDPKAGEFHVGPGFFDVHPRTQEYVVGHELGHALVRGFAQRMGSSGWEKTLADMGFDTPDKRKSLKNELLNLLPVFRKGDLKDHAALKVAGKAEEANDLLRYLGSWDELLADAHALYEMDRAEAQRLIPSIVPVFDAMRAGEAPGGSGQAVAPLNPPTLSEKPLSGSPAQQPATNPLPTPQTVPVAAPAASNSPLVDTLRANRGRADMEYRVNPANAAQPEPYQAFAEAVRDLPDDVNRQYQVHGLASGDPDANLVDLLDKGIDSARGFNSGPPKGGVHGVDSTRTNAPYLLLSDPGKSLLETGVKHVVANDAAQANLAALKKAYPDVDFMTPTEAADFMRNQAVNAPEPQGEPVPLKQQPLNKGPKPFGDTVQAGQTVTVEGRPGTWEVVNASDRSVLKVRQAGKPDAPMLSVGRDTVKPVEEPLTSKPESPQTAAEARPAEVSPHEGVLREAHSQAEEIRQEAIREATDAAPASRKTGYDEGLKDGLAADDAGVERLRQQARAGTEEARQRVAQAHREYLETLNMDPRIAEAEDPARAARLHAAEILQASANEAEMHVRASRDEAYDAGYAEGLAASRLQTGAKKAATTTAGAETTPSEAGRSSDVVTPAGQPPQPTPSQPIEVGGEKGTAQPATVKESIADVRRRLAAAHLKWDRADPNNWQAGDYAVRRFIGDPFGTGSKVQQFDVTYKGESILGEQKPYRSLDEARKKAQSHANQAAMQPPVKPAEARSAATTPQTPPQEQVQTKGEEKNLAPFTFAEQKQPMTATQLESKAKEAADRIGTTLDKFLQNPEGWRGLVSNPEGPLARFWLESKMQEQGKPFPQRVSDLMLELNANLNGKAPNRGQEVMRIRKDLTEAIQTALKNEKTFLERMLDGEEPIALTGKRLPPGALEGKIVKEEPKAPPKPQQTSIFDATPEQQLQNYQAELADLRKGRAETQAQWDSAVQEMAVSLAKDATATNNRLRLEFWERIKQHGYIGPYRGNAKGLNEDFYKRLPATVNHLKRLNGVPLDELASDMGYPNEDALIRDIVGFANVGKVDARQHWAEAEEAVGGMQTGAELKSLLDYYKEAESSVLAGIAEKEGVSSGREAAAQTGAQVGPGGAVETVRGNSPEGSQGGPGRSGTGQSEAPLNNQDAPTIQGEGVSSAREELRQKTEATIGRETGSSETGAVSLNGRPVRTKPGQKYASPDAEFEEEWQASKGIPKPAWTENLMPWLESLKNQATRDYEHLPRTAEFAQLRNELHKLERGKGIASDKAVRYIQGITVNFNPDQYDLFTRRLVLDDLTEDLKIQQEKGEEPRLPFKLTPQKVAQEKARIDALVAQEPEVQKSVDQRKRLVKEVRDEYMKAAEESVGFRPQLGREDYYRHQIIAYANLKGGWPKGTGPELKAPTNRGFTKARTGSELNYNTEYIQAEHEWMAQMLYDTQVFRLLKFVKTEYDIMPQLKQEAKAANDAAIMPYFAKLAQEANEGLGPQSTPKTAEDMYRATLSRKQAMAMSKLQKLAADGGLPGDNGRFDELIDGLRDVYEENRAIKADNPDWTTADLVQLDDKLMPQLQHYMSYLLQEQGGEPGSGAAALWFKGIREKEVFLKENLGSKYQTWESILATQYPDHAKLQPRQGSLMFSAYAIPEKVMAEAMDKALESIDVNPAELQKVMVVGGRRPEIAVPTAVADTLAELGYHAPGSAFDQGIRKVMGAWKQWQLLSPRRFIKYMTNNASGDADAAFAGNPVAFKRVPKATEDLYNFLVRRGAPSQELEQWLDRGGLHLTQQVAEHIGNLNGLEVFWNIMDRKAKSLKTTVAELPATAWKAYWSKVRGVSDFREALLRFANYEEYLSQMQANKEGLPKNFGASLREEVMALPDIHDRAFKLSNDLLGAYDEVTVAGQWLADRYAPFWRWQEVNAKRYYRLMRNAWEDGAFAETVGRAASKKLANTVVRSPIIAANLGKFVLKANFYMAMLMGFNYLFHRKEEEELPGYVRAKPHVIVGRNDDGTVRYLSPSGAFSDFVEWFGLDVAPQHLHDFLTGNKSLKEIVTEMVKSPVNKLTGAIGGPAKSVVESVFGYTLFPDVTQPRPIRDRWQHLADSVGLGDAYQALSGKPMKGDPGESRLGRYANTFTKSVVSQSDPLQGAYSDFYDVKDQWLKAKGKGYEGGRYSAKSNALYYFKLGIRYHDADAAKKYLAEYAALGGTKDGLNQSIDNMDPLFGIPKASQGAFLNSLTPEEKELYERAKEFYEKVLKAGDYRGMPEYAALPKK